MSERKIPFSFATLSLAASDYSITVQDKLVQIPLANGTIRTYCSGTAAVQVRICGKLPSSESSAFFEALRWQVASSGKSLTIDGATYSSIMLDRFTITPSKDSGFADFTLEFHF